MKIRRDLFSVSCCLLLTIILGAGFNHPVNADTTLTPASLATLPLMFVSSEPTTGSSSRFEARGLGGMLYFTPSEIVLVLPNDKTAFHQLAVKFEGANPQPQIEVSDQLSAYVNIFRGNDAAKWREGISTYSTLTYQALYPGIASRYEGTMNAFKGTFIVEPYADPSLIRWHYEGAVNVELPGDSGDVNVHLPNGDVLIERAPIAWQEIQGERIPVETHFIHKDGALGFSVGTYNRAYPLLLDPTIEYSTYIGGSSRDVTLGVEVDDNGFVYVTGLTESTNFPDSVGTYTQQLQGKTDAFVMKINPNAVGGASLIWSTYIGGNHPSSGNPFSWTGKDEGFGIALDDSGNIYVTGTTRSNDFPVTGSAYQSTNPDSGAGGDNAFLSKLSPDGTTLLYSTYLGGSSPDIGLAIAVDSSENAYIGGITQSLGQHGSLAFPLTPNAYSQVKTGPQMKAFISKIDTTQSGAASLVYSTYLGGTNTTNTGMGLDADEAGNIYITGMTSDPTFPVTANAYQSTVRIDSTTGNPSEDAFITQLDTTQSGAASLVYSTFLGGTREENRLALSSSEGFYPTTLNPDISVSNGLIYVTGGTMSPDFPIVNGFDNQRGSGDIGSVYPPYFDAYVARINPQKSGAAGLEYSTYLGGNQFDTGTGIEATGQGNVYVTGSTAAVNFPLRDAIQSQVFGDVTAFATKIDTNLVGDESLVYSTYVGRNSISYGGIAVDGIGTAYIGGSVATSGFPIVFGFQPSYGGNTDGFLIKLAFRADLQITKTLEPDPAVVDVPMTITIQVKNKGPETATAIFLTEVLPDDVLDFVDATTSQGECEYLMSVLRCDLGYLEDQQIATVTINIIPTDATLFPPPEGMAAPQGDPRVAMALEDVPEAIAAVDGVEQDLNEADNTVQRPVGVYTFDTYLATLLEPASSTTNTRPTFRWQPIPGAVSYELQLDWPDLNDAITIPVNSTSYQPPSALLTTAYQWRVRGVDASSQYTAWSLPSTVTITAPDNAAPLLNLVDAPTLTLSWNRVSWAVGYELHISRNANFTNMLTQQTFADSGVLSYTLSTPANGTYYWRVRALKAGGGTGDWSKAQTFTVAR